MNATATTVRVYVASLSDYNAGRLLGAWIDVPTDADELRAAIAAVLAKSKEPIAEEWAIHDYDGFPNMGEYPDVDKMCEIMQALETACDPDAFLAWVNHEPYNAENPSRFEDTFQGCYDSEKDYAYDYVESTGMLDTVNENFVNYFDYDSFTRDLFMDLDAIPDGHGGIYVFDNNA